MSDALYSRNDDGENDVQEEKRAAYAAMVSCPTGSIRLEQPDPLVTQVIESAFPLAIDSNRLPTVFHLGHHSKNSYGAAPYLIVRREGNVMVDCPRYSKTLASHIEAVGGVSTIFLTHKDDVCDHAKWKVSISSCSSGTIPSHFHHYYAVLRPSIPP